MWKYFEMLEENQTEYYDYVWESFLHLLKEATFLYPIKTLSKILSGNARRQLWIKCVELCQVSQKCQTRSAVSVSIPKPNEGQFPGKDHEEILKEYYITWKNHSMIKRLNSHNYFVVKNEYAWAR